MSKVPPSDRFRKEIRTFFEQMKGRGVRIIGEDDLRAVTPDADAGKSHFVIVDAVVESIDGTYFNFDKVDGQGASECTLIFLWGIGLDPTPISEFASASGVELHVHLGDEVVREQPLFTIHAETHGELNYVREFAFSNGDIIHVG